MGFVWGRQWLTLCSICFFAGRKCFLGQLRRAMLKLIEIQLWKKMPGALGMAVLAWAKAGGYAAAATGQVLPGVPIRTEC